MVLWSESYPIVDPLASDGERIFAISALPTTGSRLSQLMAIDIETGRVDWMGPYLASRISGVTSLVLMEDTVFVADFLGNIIAVAPETGTIIWSTPQTIRTPTADETKDITGTPPNLVGSVNGLFVAYSSGEVSRYDASTGQKLGTVMAGGVAGDQEMYVSLSATDSHLLARVAHEPNDSEQASVDLLLLDPHSLEVISELQVSTIVSNVVLLSDSAYFAVAGDPGEPIQLVAMNLESGQLSEPIPGVTAEQFLFLSASGGTLMITTDLGGVTLVDSADHTVLFQAELPITGPAFPRPPLMWNSDPIIIPGNGNIYGFSTEPNGSATPAATPVPN
jgi:outer membrane protein assembly factor BamB